MFDLSKWRFFKISDLFIIKTGKDLIMNSLNKGIYPIVGHSNINNGIVNFCEFLEDYPLFDCKKTISLADRGTFQAYVQPYDYYIATRVKVLISKYKNISVNSLLFIASIINLEEIKYRYGRNATDKIPHIEILLPSKDEKPDYNFMHFYIENLKTKKIEKKILENKIMKNPLILPDPKTWQEFKMIEIFEKIIRGKRLKSEDRECEEGKKQTLYFSASELDNGFSDKITNPLFIEKDALIYTTFGDCFYVEGEFTASDTVNILKNSKMDKYSALFIATVISQGKIKFCYGRQAYMNKFENEIIKLPAIKEKGEAKPDFAFMSEYIKNLKYSEFI